MAPRRIILRFTFAALWRRIHPKCAVRLARAVERLIRCNLADEGFAECVAIPDVHEQDQLTQVELDASPMMLFQIPDCEVLNQQLVEEAQAMRARSPGLTRSNRDGWHSEDDFFGRTEPGCTALRAHILEAVQETTRLLSPDFDFAANRALCQGWINVNPPGAFNGPHDHSGFALSGVYYASVPPEGHSGAIEFLDPRVNANAYLIEGAACFNRKFVINPKPGNLLVFRPI